MTQIQSFFMLFALIIFYVTIQSHARLRHHTPLLPPLAFRSSRDLALVAGARPFSNAVGQKVGTKEFILMGRWAGGK
jgi:hypothetical protein